MSDLEDVCRLVSIDQRAAYLASAGMLELGYGQPKHLTGGAAAAAAEPVADGGIGADLDDVDITEAWVYLQQGRVLDKWVKILREARKTAVDTADAAMKGFIGACYKGYIGRMVNPDMWTATRMQHHHQPLWRASIIAHCRWRGRRVAMRIAREHHRWPVRTVTDSWVYLLPGGEDIADPSGALGKMTVEKDVILTDTRLASMASAADVHEVNLAIRVGSRELRLATWRA